MPTGTINNLLRNAAARVGQMGTSAVNAARGLRGASASVANPAADAAAAPVADAAAAPTDPVAVADLTHHAPGMLQRAARAARGYFGGAEEAEGPIASGLRAAGYGLGRAAAFAGRVGDAIGPGVRAVGRALPVVAAVPAAVDMYKHGVNAENTTDLAGGLLGGELGAPIQAANYLADRAEGKTGDATQFGQAMNSIGQGVADVFGPGENKTFTPQTLALEKNTPLGGAPVSTGAGAQPPQTDAAASPSANTGAAQSAGYAGPANPPGGPSPFAPAPGAPKSNDPFGIDMTTPPRVSPQMPPMGSLRSDAALPTPDWMRSKEGVADQFGGGVFGDIAAEGAASNLRNAATQLENNATRNATLETARRGQALQAGEQQVAQRGQDINLMGQRYSRALQLASFMRQQGVINRQRQDTALNALVQSWMGPMEKSFFNQKGAADSYNAQLKQRTGAAMQDLNFTAAKHFGGRDNMGDAEMQKFAQGEQAKQAIENYRKTDIAAVNDVLGNNRFDSQDAFDYYPKMVKGADGQMQYAPAERTPFGYVVTMQNGNRIPYYMLGHNGAWGFHFLSPNDPMNEQMLQMYAPALRAAGAPINETYLNQQGK